MYLECFWLRFQFWSMTLDILKFYPLWVNCIIFISSQSIFDLQEHSTARPCNHLIVWWTHATLYLQQRWPLFKAYSYIFSFSLYDAVIGKMCEILVGTKLHWNRHFRAMHVRIWRKTSSSLHCCITPATCTTSLCLLHI